jgi:hypothetical protein
MIPPAERVQRRRKVVETCGATFLWIVRDGDVLSILGVGTLERIQTSYWILIFLYLIEPA